METLTAYHEAGHATISLLLGEFPDFASIRREGDSLGHVSYLPVEAHVVAEAAVYGGTTADRSRVTAYLLGLAAGPAAHSLRMRNGRRSDFLDQQSWETFGGGQDYAQAQRVITACKRGASSLLLVDVDDIASEAFDFLERPEVWAAVTHVANDLMRFGELDYEGIRDAVMYHDAIRPQSIVDRLKG